MPMEELDPSLQEWPVLVKSAKSWTRKLVPMYTLRLAIHLFGDALLDNTDKVKGRCPAEWWKKEQDIDLLKGEKRVFACF